jgi:hypothetical protein
MTEYEKEMERLRNLPDIEGKVEFYEGYFPDYSGIRSPRPFFYYCNEFLRMFLAMFKGPEHKAHWLRWLINQVENENYNEIDYWDIGRKNFPNVKASIVKLLQKDLKLFEILDNSSNTSSSRNESIQFLLNKNNPDFFSIIESSHKEAYLEVEKRWIEDGLISEKGVWNGLIKKLQMLYSELDMLGYFRTKKFGVAISFADKRKAFEQRYSINLSESFEPARIAKVSSPNRVFLYIPDPRKKK